MENERSRAEPVFADHGRQYTVDATVDSELSDFALSMVYPRTRKSSQVRDQREALRLS